MAVKRRPCRQCGRNRDERFFVSDKGRVCTDCQKKTRRSATRDARLRETYGITEVEYLELLEAQGGACAICGRKPRYNMDVDHCHETGVVRGLLCKLCNRRLLPAVRDQVEVLAKAIEYLEGPPAVALLGEHRVPDYSV